MRAKLGAITHKTLGRILGMCSVYSTWTSPGFNLSTKKEKKKAKKALRVAEEDNG
jgi:hypothetical protein